MSLQVWLPLTKDLRQQGLSDTVITNHGATFDSNGKLGGCYSFDGTDDNLSYTPSVDEAETLSIAFWVCPAVATPAGSFFSLERGTYWQLTFYGDHVAIRDNSIGYSGTRKNFSTGTYIANTWTHVAVTYDKGTLKIDRDGSLLSTNSVGGTKLNTSINNARIGSAVQSGYYYSGKMNDVRIYDNCLSPMEVKELAKGLVLHYPLNRGGRGQENLATCDNTVQWNIPSSTSNYNYVWANSGTLEPNTTYTFSAEVEVSDNIDKCTIFNYISGDYTGTRIDSFPADGKRHSWTFTTSSTAIGLIIYAGVAGATAGHTATYKNIKIEKGSIATPYVPRTGEELYTTLGLNETTEYDCSGFCNNGKYYAYDTNGSISYISDTPKYSVSTHIASANPTQNAASGTRYLYGHCELTNPTQMSVAFWLKPITGGYGGTTSNGQGYFCTTNYEYGNTNVGSDYQASAMNHRDGAVNMNDSASTTQCNVTFYPTIGEWHHYVYTYDGQVGRGYKDGVQTATAQFNAAKTLDSFIGVIIGFSKAGGVWRRNDACYSDFRIYATALSADDVKSLYQNCATIDPDGIIRGQIRS